jgi:hypothetical protein
MFVSRANQNNPSQCFDASTPLFLFFNVLITIAAGACRLPLAIPAFAMIYLVLQLYDPDATSAP